MWEKKPDPLEERLYKYERLYIKFTWVFILFSFFYSNLMDLIYKDADKRVSYTLVSVAFLAVIIILNFIRHMALKKKPLNRKNFYYFYRFSGIFVIMCCIEFIGLSYFGYLYITIMIMVTSLSKGTRAGMIVTSIAFMTNLFLSMLNFHYLKMYTFPSTLRGDRIEDAVLVFSYYVIYIITASICGRIHSDNISTEEENRKLVTELAEKYNLIAVTQEEAKVQYERLKETNSKLEDSNTKLTSSIAEFFTLQQISQAISSILDVKELLRYVNDIILGVMGVNYSTIILYDDKHDKLKVYTTNIRERDENIAFTDNINCSILMDSLKNSKPILENNVNPEEYEFTQDRDIRSLLCIPLSTKTRSFGLFLVEHKLNDAFNENNMRLLDIIGQQVGIAMENAELYQKMHEMATIDGLTGVYNRLYFQQRLKSELANAITGGYKLSLAIFDIDHFKKFNDTYGHLFGDKVLKEISKTVNGSLRKTDILARFGGEEFIMLFPHTSMEEAYEKVEALRVKISKTFVKDELVTASVTVSFGISTYPISAVSEAELLRSADDALYEAKGSGRNCVKLAGKL